MFLSDLSIKQPVLATMMIAALAVLGLTSYQALKVDLFPDVEFPVVTVTTRYAGASPETVERDVTKTIEESVNTVEGVRHIESTSQEGLSNIVVQFNIGVPALTARAVSEIADKLVKRRLENVAGVGAVNLVGEAKREIQVIVDRTQLE